MHRDDMYRKVCVCMFGGLERKVIDRYQLEC